MDRSGSQKVLKVISIIEIVIGVLALLGGALIAFGGSALIADNAAQFATETGISAGEGAGIATLLGGGTFVAGIVEIITGVLGLRAAKDNQKIMPVWVLAIVSLVLNVISLISGIAQGQVNGGTVASYISGLVLSGLMFWIANNIKQQAGK